jgi:hypothetical protein
MNKPQPDRSTRLTRNTRRQFSYIPEAWLLDYFTSHRQGTVETAVRTWDDEQRTLQRAMAQLISEGISQTL